MQRKVVSRYLKWLYDHSEGARWPICRNIILSIVNVAVNLYFIYVSKRLVDIATGDATGSLAVWTAVILVTILLRLLLNAALIRLENITYYKVNFRIRASLYDELIRSRWFGKESLHSGDTLNRLMADVDVVSKTICSDFTNLVKTSVQLVAAFTFFCLLEWKLAVILLLITPLFLAFSKIFFKQMRKLTRDIRDSESNIQSHIQESIQNKLVIQSMETEGLMNDRLENLQDTEYDQVMVRTRFSVFSSTVVRTAFNLGYIAAFLWGVFGIAGGRITYGIMTAFLQLVAQIQNPSMALSRLIPSFAYATASIDRLQALENFPKDEEGEPVLVSGAAGVRLENVSFRYPDGRRDIFRDFSFDFKPGSRTSLVGETGVGKSTLIRLMMSLLKPDEGRVVLYNDAGFEVEASALTRRNIVYVPQGNTLLSGTVRDNLLLGDPDADEENMRHALETAAAGFVFDLPDGLDTICGEQGAGLSEGQAQRIAIARGLLRPGSVMLFDEFSSSLDSVTEDRLMKNLTAAYPEKTMIFITHREHISDFCDSQLRLRRNEPS